MKIEMNLSEIKSREFLSWLSECLYNNEHIFIAEENTIINTGSDCIDYVYTIVPQEAINITITNRNEECDRDYPYAVFLDINEKDYGLVGVYSRFIDVITKELFDKTFKEESE